MGGRRGEEGRGREEGGPCPLLNHTRNEYDAPGWCCTTSLTGTQSSWGQTRAGAAQTTQLRTM